MGKLGGGELNVSSDIDLVFVYPEEGETAGPRVIANREYFDRLGRRVDRRAQRRRPPMATCSASTCGCALRRERPADDVVRRPRALPRHAGPRVGALRVAQGARAHRHAPRRARRARHAVRLPQVPRLRRVRGPARRPPADPRAGARRDALRRQRQARRRRHPRNRVHRAGACRSCAADASPTCACAARCRRSRRSARAHCCRRRPRRRCATPTSFLRNVEHRLQYRDDQQTHQLPDGCRRARGARRSRWTSRRRRVRRARCARTASVVVVHVRADVRRRRRTADDAGATRRSRRCGRSPRPTPGIARAGATPATTIPDALLAIARRACASRAATCSCRPRRASASTRWCRSCSRSLPAHPGPVGRAGRVRAAAGAARDGRAPQRLPRARHRAPAAAAAARQPHGRVGVGRRLPDAASAAARRTARCARADGGARLGRVARRARAPARRSARTTPSTRWTCCATSSMRRRSACWCRTWAGGSPSSGWPITCRRWPTSCSTARSTACWRTCRGRRRAAAALRDHRLRQARRQGAGLRVGPRPRVPVRHRRRRSGCRRARARATRGSRSGSTRG